MIAIQTRRLAAVPPTTWLLTAFFAYLFVAPAWGFYWVDAWHNEQRAVQVILLLATGMVVVRSAKRWTMLVPASAVGWMLWLFAIWGAISAACARFVIAGFVEVALHVLLVLVVVVTRESIRQDSTGLNVWIRRACVLLGLIHVAGIAARYVAMLALERAPGIEVLLLGYANPRFPSALYALLIPFIAMFILAPREHPALRRSAWLILALLWCVNIALGTRAVWFSYGLALPALVLIVGWRRLVPAAWVLGSTVAVGLLMYLILFVAVPTWLSLGSALPSHVDHLTSVGDRVHLWRLSLELLTTHPMLGVGPMNFAGLGDSYASHPHNWPLQIGAEWGLPALTLLLAVLLYVGRDLLVRIRPPLDNDIDVLGPLAAVIVGILYGLVDGNLVMPVSQTAFALAVGILLGTTSTRPQLPPGSRWSGVVAAAFVMISAACLTYYTVLTLPRQQENERTWRATSTHPDLAPRFWQQGLLLR